MTLLFDTESLALLDDAAPYEIGALVDSDTDALSVIAEVLSSVGAALVPNDNGILQAVRIAVPSGTPVATFTLRDIEEIASIALAKGPSEEGEGVPVYEVRLTWGRVWQVQAEGDLAGDVTELRRAYVKESTRKIVVSNAAVKTAHPLSSALDFATLLTSSADAQAETGRRAVIYGTRRDYLAITVDVADADGVTLGAVVSLVVPRFGWQAGKFFLVVGRRDDFTKRVVTLSIWG